jgi:hypothetical protein
MIFCPKSIHCTVHVYIVIHFCNTMWSFLVDANHRRFSHRLITHVDVLQLENQLSRLGRDPISWFNPAIFVCLSQTRLWVSNVICRAPHVWCSVS